MDTDDLLKRVRTIPGVMEARIMHARQRDRLYVKVPSGNANPVNRRVHRLLELYPNLGLLYEYEQAEPCGAYTPRSADHQGGPAAQPELRRLPGLRQTV